MMILDQFVLMVFRMDFPLIVIISPFENRDTSRDPLVIVFRALWLPNRGKCQCPFLSAAFSSLEPFAAFY